MLRRALLDFALAVSLVALCAALVVVAGCTPQGEPQAAPLAPLAVPAAAPAAESAPAASPHGPIPRAALAYRAGLTRTARAVWGLGAPVATFAAQVHQESAWNPRAVSRAGAAGLAQFMPATSTWISGLDPQLQANEPFSAAWALRAMVTYDQWLFERAPPAYGPRDRMWVALRAYNGGLGHWQAESRRASDTSRAAVDAACGSAKRARSHCPENLGYPRRILLELQPRYLAWGPGV